MREGTKGQTYLQREKKAHGTALLSPKKGA
jgi:hypothetical protein